jgi:hypothetical protein
VSSITCGWMPKRAAASRSMVSTAVVPPVCWSVATSRNSGRVFSIEDLGAQNTTPKHPALQRMVLRLGRGPTRTSCPA